MAEENEKATPTQANDTGLEGAVTPYRTGATDAPMEQGAARYGNYFDVSSIRDAFSGMAVNARHKDQAIRHANLYSGELTSQDPNIQFSISQNASNDAPPKDWKPILRFGGLLGVENFARLYDQPVGAEVNPQIVDQFGGKVLKTQGFNHFASHIPVVVTEFRVLTNRLRQLNAGWGYYTLNPNSVVTQDTISIGATRQKSDDTSDLVVVQGCWLLDAHHYLQTELKPPQSESESLEVDYILSHSAIANVRSFTQFL